MTREEIRDKYRALVSGELEASIKFNKEFSNFTEEFRKLKEICPHPFGRFEDNIGCWICPDCGMSKEHGC